MKKLFFLSLCVLFFSSLRADFFGFRKLENKDTGKTVYLLYDVHISMFPTVDSYREAQLSRGRFSAEYRQKERKLSLKERMERNLEASIEKFSADYIKNHLPHLFKQHNDLLAIVKSCGISLINEEWEDRFSGSEVTVGAGADKHLLYLIGRIFKDEGKAGAIHISPMQGIGKKLLREYTKRQLKNIPGLDAFYFNPDNRTLSYIQSEKESKEVDVAIQKGLALILDKKDSVIVAVGAAHAVDLTIFLESQGYVSGPFIINEKLQELRTTHAELDAVLKNFEVNKDSNFGWSTGFADHSTIGYDLYENPLDLKVIFREQLGPCASESTVDPVHVAPADVPEEAQAGAAADEQDMVTPKIFERFKKDIESGLENLEDTLFALPKEMREQFLRFYKAT